MYNLKHILVVSRMIPYSRNAIQCGFSLAQKYNSKLSVLHLVADPVEMMAINAPGMFLAEEYKNYLSSKAEVKERLDKMIMKETRNGFPIKELISDGDPAKEVVRVVSEEGIDLIIMLAHQEGVIEHALFGGENDAIIRRMPCSILLVKNEPGPVKW
jgi:nucleotide-binding universal stress UspA family protein